MGSIAIKCIHSFQGHKGSIFTLQKWQNTSFISAGQDGMVAIWNLDSLDNGKLIAKVDGSIYALYADLENNLLYVGQNYHGIYAIDMGAKVTTLSVKLGNYQIFDINSYRNYVICTLSSGDIVILDKGFQIIKHLSFSQHSARSINLLGDLAAVTYSDKIIRIINLKNWKIIHELKAHTKTVMHAKFHPSGKFIISGGLDAYLHVWDVSAQYLLRESIPAHLYAINYISFSPDGRFFATGSMDKTIKVWNAHNFTLLKVIDKQRYGGHTNSVNKVLWLDNSYRLLSCSDDRSIAVWDIEF